MSQFYTDPSRETDENALPNAEVFWAETGELWETGGGNWSDDGDEPNDAGFYWWPCFPGCLPDGDPNGPFETEEEAMRDARGED